MPISSTSVNIGDLEYEPFSKGPLNVHVDGQPLMGIISHYLQFSKIFVADHFDKESKDIRFVKGIDKICIKVFDAIKKNKESQNEIIAIRLADTLYECFTDYWINLLWQGLDSIGIQLWNNLLAITSKWEDANKPLTVHKGSAYFFLAENYLLTGDRDKAYQYLFNALVDEN